MFFLFSSFLFLFFSFFFSSSLLVHFTKSAHFIIKEIRDRQQPESRTRIYEINKRIVLANLIVRVSSCSPNYMYALFVRRVVSTFLYYVELKS